MLCPSCGSEISPSVPFCNVCGAVVPTQNTAPNPEPIPSPAPAGGAYYGQPQPQQKKSAVGTLVKIVAVIAVIAVAYYFVSCYCKHQKIKGTWHAVADSALTLEITDDEIIYSYGGQSDRASYKFDKDDLVIEDDNNKDTYEYKDLSGKTFTLGYISDGEGKWYVDDDYLVINGTVFEK